VAREAEWGRAIAREMAASLPEAVRMVPSLKLTPKQIQALQKAFEAFLIENMK
jgi:hypothetical protein